MGRYWWETVEGSVECSYYAHNPQHISIPEWKAKPPAILLCRPANIGRGNVPPREEEKKKFLNIFQSEATKGGPF